MEIGSREEKTKTYQFNNQINQGFACTAGTTATCVFIRNGKLYTGHVGDSSIILANFMEEEAGYDDAKLTNDHKPESLSERQRIEKAGGAVASKSVGFFPSACSVS
jgi:protein phosphatase 1D